MRAPRLLQALGMCAVLLLVKAAWCAPDVYVDQIEPLAFTVDGDQQGLLYELLTELSRRVHHTGQVTPLPLKRQRHLLQSRTDTLGTLWRFPEIESDYHWWCKLLDSPFVMAAAPDSTVDISSVATAKHLRVGVILGSPAEILAHRLGFKNIQTAASADSNARKLALGRIDIWIASPRVIRAAQARLGGELKNLRVSEGIATYGVYLASSPRFDAREGEKWKSAFDSMQRDGTVALIRKKYDVPAPPSK